MRVYELAKEYGMDSKELLEKLAEMKIPARNHASTLLDAYVTKIRKQLDVEYKKETAEDKAEAEKKAEAESEAKRVLEERKKLEAQRKKAVEEEKRRRKEEWIAAHPEEVAKAKAEAKARAEAKAKAKGAENAKETSDKKASDEAAASSTENVNAEESVREPEEKKTKAQAAGKEKPSSATASKAKKKEEASSEDKKVQKKSGASKKEKQEAKSQDQAKKQAKNKGLAQDKSIFDGLLSQIAAENSRLASEKEDGKQGKGKKGQERRGSSSNSNRQKFDQDNGEAGHERSGRKRNKKKNQRYHDYDDYDSIDSESEDDRYRQMAVAAEKIQRDKILEEARAAVAEAEKESTGRRKKRKERRAAEAAKKAEEEAIKEAEKTGLAVGTVRVVSGVTVGELADALEVPANEVVKRLLLLGAPMTVTQTLSDDLVELIAGDLGREIHIVSQEEEMSFTFHDDEKDLKPRPPVVTVMGHVDHGKTSLLDAIRATGVVETEAGGITQHIGASVVWINGKQITFIDTPGHEAFTAMRARGAQVTDVIVLVVAADDGVMPQTIEAINHANAAGVPIVVAINKIDKDGANPERVRSELAEYNVISEDWGGQNMFVEVSAKQNIGIDDLLETIILQADVLELKANPDTQASGFVIEANLDKGRGSVATVIVQRGTLHVGDTLVAGTTYGHVRALIDPKGNSVTECKPADPVEILGLNSVPNAGDEFCVFADESEARKLAEERDLKKRLAAQEKRGHVSLDDLFARIENEKLAELNLIVKADVQGSIEALVGKFEEMDQSEVRINVIHSAVGGITETDVTFAAASDAIIIGFGVRPDAKARAAAEREKVDIRLYSVIYKAIEEINAARVGLLAPEEVEVDTGSADVRELFRMPKIGVIAGCLVSEGEIANTDSVRVVRNGIVVHTGKVASMRHYRDDVSSVRAGTECGISLEGFQDIKEGDILEGFRIEEVKRTE